MEISWDKDNKLPLQGAQVWRDKDTGTRKTAGLETKYKSQYKKTFYNLKENERLSWVEICRNNHGNSLSKSQSTGDRVNF